MLRNLGAAQPGHFEDVTVASGINVYRKEAAIDTPRGWSISIGMVTWTSHLPPISKRANSFGTMVTAPLPTAHSPPASGPTKTAWAPPSATTIATGILTGSSPTSRTAPGVIAPFGRWNRLYRNDGNRTFTDVTESAGVRDCRFAWGTTFFDYDNDGDVDLAATNGYNGEGWIDDRTFLWQNSNGVFTDVSDATGITDTQQGRGLIHLDYDEDGDLDLVVVNNAAAPILYRNDGGNANHFLRIKPQGTLSNRDGIGAWITVTPDLDNPHHRLVWEIDGGSSFVSQSEHVAHFGLGASDDPVDMIQVEWPATGIVQQLRNVEPNQVLSITERHPSDFNGDWQIDVADYVQWRKTLGHTVTHGTGADANGDSLIDINDYSLWRADFGATIGIFAGRGARAGEAGQSVPEPTSHILVLLAWFCIETRKTSRSDEHRRSAQSFCGSCRAHMAGAISGVDFGKLWMHVYGRHRFL